MSELDDFDVKLLNLVQEDSRRTSEALAGEVGLSATACQRRLKRLREDGVIQREVAVVDPEKVGRKLTVIVEVILQHGRPDIVDEFKRRMRALPEVQHCYYVTGASDFVLIVVTEDIKAYEGFIHRVLYASKSIQRFETTVVMDTVKAGLSVPL
ncbi:Lrp/AsnC family transcriptional regulator [Hwanghaeella sp.]|uniref:Lrp/AsnC family transcriptional regulator n=1 Tax=Hwanghaeella sp. TaxID=2605943 RepID=UPI003CCC4316